MALHYEVICSKLDAYDRGQTVPPSYFGATPEARDANIKRLIDLKAIAETDVETPEETAVREAAEAAEDEAIVDAAPEGLKDLEIGTLQGIAATLGIVNMPKSKGGLIKAIEAVQAGA